MTLHFVSLVAVLAPSFALGGPMDPIERCKQKVWAKYEGMAVMDLKTKGILLSDIEIHGDTLVVDPKEQPFPDKRLYFEFVRGTLKKDTYTKIGARGPHSATGMNFPILRIKPGPGYFCDPLLSGRCILTFDGDGLLKTLVIDKTVTPAEIRKIFDAKAGTSPSLTFKLKGDAIDKALERCDKIKVEEASSDPKVQEAVKPKSLHRKGTETRDGGKANEEATL